MVHTDYQKYDIVDNQYILNLWKNLDDKFHVYIHSPFCPTICKFCIYNGVKASEEEYSNYYDNYLPNVLNFYSPILEQKKENIVSWFFGGGTPSLMTADTMKKVFQSIPNFKNSKGEKTFEVYPAIWSIEQLDVLQEYNFNNIIICLQTFDRKTLIKQKRIPSSLEDVIKLNNELKKRNFNVCVDVISFLNHDEKDNEILMEDLELVYENIFPDEISVQTVYQNKKFTKDTFEVLFNSKFISEGNYGIEHLDIHFTDVSDPNKVKEDLMQSNMINKCLRLFKIDKINDYLNKKFCSFIPSMDPSYAHAFQKTPVHTLAIGSYKNEQTQTHSNVGKFNYIERNDDNKQHVFKFVSDSYFKELQFFYNLLCKLGEPPKNLVISILNNFYYEKEIPLHLDFEIRHYEQGKNLEADQYISEFYKLLEEEKIKIKNKLFSNQQTVIFKEYVRP